MNSTTDPNKRSYIEVDANSDFPIQNLPYGVCRPKSDNTPRCCSIIGDVIIDLAALERLLLLPRLAGESVFAAKTLNKFAALGKPAWDQVRMALSELLDANNPRLRDDAELRAQVFVPQDDVDMLLPMEIGDYTDFYSSKEHATNVGCMFRDPENALLPNWLHLPVAYHGRSSTIVVSGEPVKRPHGQKLPAYQQTPVFGASQAMDFELEMGFYIGPGSGMGEAVSVHEAEDRIFGLSLVNDWSARDIQLWEYVPLGPFLGKNFATSVSPWIVPLAALEPFRCDGPEQEPKPLDYLRSDSAKHVKQNTFDIELNVQLATRDFPTGHSISRSNFRHLYWSMSQQLAHHTCNGCRIRTGDLLASGTISGPTPDSLGSMLELAWKGERPIQLPNGETRAMLQDGDVVTMTGFAQGDGYRIGFGELTGEIVPA